ncbi:tagaturonate reductase [Evansella sp. AB-P1]|uniref:tagaturonate reductase n=1 Tax=Evansella sp. AB-P1 TaxID=3037653 RepID=UPI00241C3C78|nr:tagaturonate reductase [Evansella sp. AB-P1]MDG5787863.1 tagaturonate reductase [Evansella sp. AB-P1]
MKELNKTITKADMSSAVEFNIQDNLPEKVLQIGEGNFLRGFIDWLIHQMNKQGVFNGKAVVVQPINQGPVIQMLNDQDGLYTVVLRGVQNGEVVEKSEVISSISRGLNPYTQWEDVQAVAASKDLEIVISNTTEAGITYVKEEFEEGKTPESYPAKLTSLLYHRYKAFNGSPESGLIIIPCELIEENATKLKELVFRLAEEWKLPAEFTQWLSDNNRFCNTLVDRIVTGYPRDAVEEFRELLGYKDNLITVGEPYHMFAVDGDEVVQEKIPFHKAGLNIKWGDITPHRELKVRLLNAPHTMMFSASYLYGVDTVLEVMENETLRKFVDQGFEELVPTVRSDEGEKKQFVDSVVERFLNPYNKHFLLDIGLNAVYKYKSRILPSLQRFAEQEGTLPKTIVFSLASLFAFYRPIRQEGDALVGSRNGEEYTMRENDEVIQAVLAGWGKVDNGEATVKELVTSLLGNKDIWSEDLNDINGLTDAVSDYLQQIVDNGMKASVESLVNNK